MPFASCRICQGTGKSPFNWPTCLNCKYGGNCCMRAGLIDETCWLPSGHQGPHVDKEANITWFGGVGGFDPKFDNIGHAGPFSLPSTSKKVCCCPLKTIIAKGCQCGGV